MSKQNIKFHHKLLLSICVPISGLTLVTVPSICLASCSCKKPEPVSPGKTTKPFETCDWSYINEKATDLETAQYSDQAIVAFCNSFTLQGDDPETTDVVEESYIPNELSDFVGVEKKVKINNNDHSVRVIGYKHDKLANSDNYSALTFEFANVICDSNGKSLACQWNDVLSTETDGSNFDYTSATIQQNLNGSGDECAIWFEKGNTTPFKGKSVLNMLPTDLSSVIKPVEKTVGQHTTGGDSWTDMTHSTTETIKYNAQLFLPCYDEIHNLTEEPPSTYAKNEGSLYEFYQNHSTPIDTRKYQVVREQNPTRTQGTNTITKYDQYINNWAGVDCPEFNNLGAYYWLSSPFTYNTTYSWYMANGGLPNNGEVYEYAYAVAPAFCI